MATLVPGAAAGELGAGVRRVHQVDAARVDDDQPRALAQAALELGAEHRVGVGGVGADHQITSACITESKLWVPADSPRVCFRP
jgi:hypothetical protein